MIGSPVAERNNVKQLLDKAIASKPSSLDNSVDQWHKCLQLIKDNDACLIAHYYVDDHLQKLAEETGGFVGDSLQMAQFGALHNSQLLVVAGVRFMGETAKILNPEKTVLMPSLRTECSLDLSCSVSAFTEFCNQYPQHTKVVYANTSARVKAESDWVVTSSIAVDLIEHLDSSGKKIIWAPDKHLGKYLNSVTGAEMILWDGACVVHEEFKAHAIEQLMTLYPDSALLAHPESPESVLAQATAIGSTSQLIKQAQSLDFNRFIVATDRGIFYKMQQAVPNKELIIAPTAGQGATCKSCAHCPWMAINSLRNLAETLENKDNSIEIDAETISKALIPLERMLKFSQSILR